MTGRPSAKATRVLAALPRIGWPVKRQTGSRILVREERASYVFAFHDRETARPLPLASEVAAAAGAPDPVYVLDVAQTATGLRLVELSN